jgi:hypothetical protein
MARVRNAAASGGNTLRNSWDSLSNRAKAEATVGLAAGAVILALAVSCATSEDGHRSRTGIDECPPGYVSGETVRDPSKLIQAFTKTKVQIERVSSKAHENGNKTPILDRVDDQIPSDPNQILGEMVCAIPPNSPPLNPNDSKDLLVLSPEAVQIEAELSRVNATSYLDDAVTTRSIPKINP